MMIMLIMTLGSCDLMPERTQTSAVASIVVPVGSSYILEFYASNCKGIALFSLSNDAHMNFRNYTCIPKSVHCSIENSSYFIS
jgi:hypothetical protein